MKGRGGLEAREATLLKQAGRRAGGQQAGSQARQCVGAGKRASKLIENGVVRTQL